MIKLLKQRFALRFFKFVELLEFFDGVVALDCRTDDTTNVFFDRLRRDAMFFIERHLDRPTAFRLIDRPLHRIRDFVGKQDDMTFRVSRCPTNRLNQRTIRAKEPFLIGIKNRNERDFRNIESFSE